MTRHPVISLAALLALSPVETAAAQDNSLPSLTRRAIAACEVTVSAGTPLTGQPGLEGFAPRNVPAATEALYRGFDAGENQVYVQVMRNSEACVVMIRDTVRSDAERSVTEWLATSGIILAPRPNGTRWARRGTTEYQHHVANGDIQVILVANRP